MYYVDQKGKRKSVENFRNPSEMSQERQAPLRENYPVVENYGGKKKCPKWLYWVLGAIALIILVLLVIWLIRVGKKKGSSGVAMQKFGFRFY